MWLSPDRITRRRLCVRDFRASSFNAFEKPLHTLGFVPSTFALVFGDMQRPLGTYIFVRKNETVRFFFSRSRPFWFLHTVHGRIRHRSEEWGTLDELEAAFARYFKVPAFTPQRRAVIEWPLRGKPALEKELPCKKQKSLKSSS